MDRQTIDYYDRNAEELGARYRSLSTAFREPQFREAFPHQGSRIVDIGSGSGRDVQILLNMGHDVIGFEPSAAMRMDSERNFPALVGRILPHALPLSDEAGPAGSFDGVLCCAALMHVPEAELLSAALSVRGLLRTGGRLLLSVPADRSHLDADARDENHRLFTPLFRTDLKLLFERLGFELVREWTEADGLGRPAVNWNTFLFQLQTSGSRPLDLIAGVMNYDRKWATYKFALFRALSEIAISQYRNVRWISDEQVAVPAKLIAEKWFEYYWPLFECRQFVPQRRAETPGCAKPVIFRMAETEIVERYRNRGGLSQFLMDERAGTLGTIRQEYEQTIACIVGAIKDGPVVHASGKMFGYDNSNASVLVKADAWSEFSRFGHWIEPAVVLRWAEETQRMSADSIRAGEVLNLLVIDPTEERKVQAVRDLVDNLDERPCVWSGVPLADNYQIDHVIPFSFWHCNDLWNLLPCGGQINNAKRDKLPSRKLLLDSKPRIFYYWEKLRGEYPTRFDRELERYAWDSGAGDDWQYRSFNGLLEAVELTAIQRSAKRWQPRTSVDILQ